MQVPPFSASRADPISTKCTFVEEQAWLPVHVAPICSVEPVKDRVFAQGRMPTPCAISADPIITPNTFHEP